jgi:hypothetical protein
MLRKTSQSHVGHVAEQLPCTVGAASMAAYGSGVALVLQGSTDSERGAVWFTTYTEDGGWTEVRRIASASSDDGSQQCWDPALHVDANGIPRVFYTVGEVGEGRPSPLSGMMTQADESGSFSPPQALPEGMLGPTRSGSGVRLDDGTILFIAEYDTLRIEATDELFDEWEIVARINDEDSLEPIEPALCRYGDRGVLLCRSGCGDMVEVWSEPGFREWKILRNKTGEEVVQLGVNKYSNRGRGVG